MAETDGTVSRVVQLLRALAEAGGEATVAGLADCLGRPRSTVHRLLQLLRAEGFVDQSPANRGYRAGAELYRLSALIVQSVQLPGLARPLLAEVVAQVNETCLLGMYLPSTRQMMMVEKVDSTHPLRYARNLFEPMTLAWGASGRAILAFLPAEEIEAVLRAAEPSPATGDALPDRPQILAELAAVREAGYVLSRGQKIEGAVGLAAPVWGAAGGVVGDLCLTVPEHRFEPTAVPGLADVVVGTARRLSAILGYAGGGRRACADAAPGRVAPGG